MLDLLIIGAGPAGLEAGYIAAKNGAKVLIVDMKRDIHIARRACSAQFVLDEGYEGETLKIGDGKLIFTKNGFEVPYNGPLVPIQHNYMISPKGYTVSFEYEDLHPTALKFDKNILLKGLLEQCEKAGVDIRPGTMALKGTDTGECVKLLVKDEKNEYELEAKKLIIAEGVNRKLTTLFGLNKGYQCMGIPLTYEYTLEGTKDIPHNSWIQYYGNVYHPFMEVMVGESCYSDDALEFTIMGIGDLKPKAMFEKLRTESPLAENLKDAKIVERKGCSCKNFQALTTPYKGNVLAIGDSAAHIEVINQGAMMCGFNAGNAILKELAGEPGFEEYTRWWGEAFEFNCEDPSGLLKMYGAINIKGNLADDEIDYLFAMLEGEQHSGHFNQYEVPKNFWTAVLKHDDTIKAENPALYEKMAAIRAYKKQGKF
ncbi:MAG: NAD(P)/FAD-dependent oxidoreductase [Stomatobaculum sp.]|nr:NAD(P)/FAD-dependent oxidoreductase [Stomatobaculum sp.]